MNTWMFHNMSRDLSAAATACPALGALGVDASCQTIWLATTCPFKTFDCQWSSHTATNALSQMMCITLLACPGACAQQLTSDFSLPVNKHCVRTCMGFMPSIKDRTRTGLGNVGMDGAQSKPDRLAVQQHKSGQTMLSKQRA